jgi:2-haloacid dehalogenase
MAARTVLVFDVNETLLDLSALGEPFEVAFGDASPLGEWFARMLHSSLVATLTDSYEDFGAIGRRALEATAVRRGVELSDERRDAILGTMRRLPPHPEVPGSLARLREAGFRLATLTNSSHATVRAQLEHAELADAFDEVFSVEDVRRFKPSPEPYLMAAERLGVDIGKIRLVAAHDWDVWGAMRAGCAAAYVGRGSAPFVIGEPPDVVGRDLDEVARRILAVDAPD